jgi:LacI family transcriptional regulator
MSSTRKRVPPASETKPWVSVTVREVAKAAGVSTGTVSNVLNRPDIVADATRERVLRAVESTGFIRNTQAYQLRGGRSQAVGVVVLDVSNPFFTEMFRGAEGCLQAEGYVLMLGSTDDSVDREARFVRALEEHRVQGVLITPVGADLDVAQALRTRGVPTVLLDRKAAADEFCSVTVDDVHGGELAATHLFDLGHRHVAFVNGPTTIRQCRDRRQGARKAVRALAKSEAAELVELPVGALTVRHGEAAVERIMALVPRPTAVMCANDLLALGVLRGLAARGVAVPESLAVVGYDDLIFGSMLSPSLTSVRQPAFELGAAAAQLLLDEVNNPDHRHREVRFEPELVVRASSEPNASRRVPQ